MSDVLARGPATVQICLLFKYLREAFDVRDGRIAVLGPLLEQRLGVLGGAQLLRLVTEILCDVRALLSVLRADASAASIEQTHARVLHRR